LEDAGFIEAYVEIVADWNQAVLEILIDAGVDLVVRRGWYESTDFWSPDLYRQFLAEPLRRLVETAHQADVKMTYVMNSGAMPLLPIFREIGFDVLSNIDPIAAGTDAGKIKREIGDEICLCGGVNNTHVLEEGTEAEVRQAVEEAMETLGPGSGFILAPGDSPGFVEGTDQSVVRRNIETMIKAWKRR
jgi:uroporphyrinogen decarboxylase